MHGGLSDDEQQTDRRGVRPGRQRPVRVLFTGDVASEGVNLHRQCHHLDPLRHAVVADPHRAAQRPYRPLRAAAHQPQFRALLSSPPTRTRTPRTTGRSPRAAGTGGRRPTAPLGEAASILGLRDEEAEGAAILEPAQRARPFNTVVQAVPLDRLRKRFMADRTPEGDSPGYQVPKLFASTRAFVDAALEEVYDNPEHRIDKHRDDDKMLVFTPDPTCSAACWSCPGRTCKRRDLEQLRVTFDKELGQDRLDRARERSGKLGKGCGTEQERTETSGGRTSATSTDLHPMVDWLTDKVLIRLGRSRPRCITADVSEPVFLIQGVYSNAWASPPCSHGCVTGLAGGTPTFDDDLVDVLRGPGSSRRWSTGPSPGTWQRLQALVPAVAGQSRTSGAQRAELATPRSSRSRSTGGGWRPGARPACRRLSGSASAPYGRSTRRRVQKTA